MGTWTMLSPDPFIGKELQRTTADVPLRRTLKRLRGKWVLEVSALEWHGNGAALLDHFSRQATAWCLPPPMARPIGWAGNCVCRGIDAMESGDCAARRRAPYAFHEERRVALEL
ncbi:hypothetical protein ABID08_004743 [Rhizobium binae]|uniref:Uncharacterized protein n=2 Tax=Rhizobium binae TaxID=1138190 RepID=A0ABV2MPZ5_9HYPH|nr:hypothetical protein [Rhizobium binae]